MPETQESIKEQIRQWVAETAERKGVSFTSDDESLTANGVIDSLAIFRLVSFLEETFGLRVADEEIVNDNFKSVNEIDRFVTGKLGSKA
ncbi:MAG TPA: acyl carrier protein [Terriglobia bacterium]|nr:acyl carrier protein [Terriglobia bacterium]